MRRVVKWIIVALALGIAINVAAAWVCAAFSEPGGFDPRVLASVRREFLAPQRFDSSGRKQTHWPSIAYSGLGARFIDIDVQTEGVTVDAFRGPWRRIGIVRAGWPLHAMEGRLHHDASRSPNPLPARTAWAIIIPDRHIRADRFFLDRLLPLKPIWPGFVVNSLSYAALLVLLAAMWLLMVRSWRRMRGQCGHCGYPTGTSPRCTECGRRLA